MPAGVALSIVDALIDVLSAAVDGVQVLDGTGGDVNDPGDYLMIGAADPDNERPEIVSARQQWHGIGGRSRTEEGSVKCVALSWNGNADASEARSGASAICADVESALRSNPNLSAAVPGLLYVEFGTDVSAELLEDESGSAVLVRFDIAYKARI